MTNKTHITPGVPFEHTDALTNKTTTVVACAKCNRLNAVERTECWGCGARVEVGE